MWKAGFSLLRPTPVPRYGTRSCARQALTHPSAPNSKDSWLSPWDFFFVRSLDPLGLGEATSSSSALCWDIVLHGVGHRGTLARGGM